MQPVLAWQDSELYFKSDMYRVNRVSTRMISTLICYFPRNHIRFHKFLWDLKLSHQCSQQHTPAVGRNGWLTGLVCSIKRIMRLKSFWTVLMSVVSRVLKLGYDLKITECCQAKTLQNHLELFIFQWEDLKHTGRVWPKWFTGNRVNVLVSARRNSIWWLWWKKTHLYPINMTDPSLHCLYHF